LFGNPWPQLITNVTTKMNEACGPKNLRSVRAEEAPERRASGSTFGCDHFEVFGKKLRPFLERDGLARDRDAAHFANDDALETGAPLG
jgi:hypothetical protein